MEPRVSKFKEIFLGLERAYGTFQPKESLREDNKAEGETWIRKNPVEDSLWESHLKGLWPSIGIFPINDEDKCRWGCIDVDEYPIDHVIIAQKIAGKNLPFIVTKSKSGGAHIFLFFKEYVNAGIVHHKIRDLASSMGLGHCEVFPKQEKLLREGNESDWEVGSFLNMPYHNGLDQTDRYAFDDKGNVLNLDGFLAEVENKSLTTEQLKKLSLKKEKSEFHDAPYCIEAYLTENGKVQKGSRDNFLFQYAVFAKKKYGESYEDEVHKFHHKNFEEALRPKEIEKIIKQADKKDWGYKCKDQPMCQFCNKSLCRIRKFGIGEDSVITDVGNVTQYGNNDDAIYHITINQESTIVCTVEELYDQHKFRKKCLVKTKSMPPMMSRNDYDAFVTSLVSKAIEVKTDEEMTPEGQFKIVLAKYISNQANAVDIDDILNGQCFVDDEENKVYFRIDQLQEYMRNRKHAALSTNQVAVFIRSLGGDSTKRKLNNKPGQLVWFVANDKFNSVEIIEAEEPAEKEEDIPF
tara:strand:+ start:1236 stop:2798 length:1563 start_codon:yes stop_codon:yes gene_type:complete